jgi:hypothetical protein
MSVFVLQNGVNVDKVKPGTGIELYANDLGYALWVESVVLQSPSGLEYFRDSKLTTFMGNVSYMINAPIEEGLYVFIPDTSRPSVSKAFAVSEDAPDPWDQEPKKINWLVIGGIVGVVGVVIGAVALFKK